MEKKSYQQNTKKERRLYDSKNRNVRVNNQIMADLLEVSQLERKASVEMAITYFIKSMKEGKVAEC